MNACCQKHMDKAPARKQMWSLTRKVQLDFSPILVIFIIQAVQIVLRHLMATIHQGLG